MLPVKVGAAVSVVVPESLNAMVPLVLSVIRPELAAVEPAVFGTGSVMLAGKL